MFETCRTPRRPRAGASGGGRGVGWSRAARAARAARVPLVLRRCGRERRGSARRPREAAVAGVRDVRVLIFVKITFDLKCAAKVNVRLACCIATAASSRGCRSRRSTLVSLITECKDINIL